MRCGKGARASSSTRWRFIEELSELSDWVNKPISTEFSDTDHPTVQALTHQSLNLSITQSRNHPIIQSDRYSGFFFQPVSIEAKLLQPCNATISRWPGMKARNPHMAAKCQIRAR